MQESKRPQKHWSTNNLCTYALVTYALTLAGCARQQELVTEQICVPDIDRAETMEIAEDVLAGLHFTVAKADIQTGLIRTRPLPGAQFFEFWRGDNVGADNALQANLHTIRRTVALDISQQDEELCIGCDVRVQRLSLPEREVSSSARAYDMFSRSGPSLQRLRFNPEQQGAVAWIDLGKDVPLATEILRRIEERILERTSSETHVAENQT